MARAFVEDERKWAELQFGSCDLGDKRRTARLVDVAARHAADPGGSTHRTCEGIRAVAEGTFRLMRNAAVRPSAMEEGPFRRTAQLAAERGVVLAIQDTTGLTFPHLSVAGQLGETGGKKGSESHGFWAHSTLMVDPEEREVLGLIDQKRWQRSSERPSAKERRQRKYEDKESFKWEESSKRLRARLVRQDNVIEVTDRESDVFEYLAYQVGAKQRLIARAGQDRTLEVDGRLLWDQMASQPVLTTYSVHISQRGAQRAVLGQKERPARPARTAVVDLRAAAVKIRLGTRNRVRCPQELAVNAVYVREPNPPLGTEPLEWMLLTTEPVLLDDQALRVVRYYECRWLIEDFHKVWKTGCRVEQRRLQSEQNLERVVVLLAHVAARVLQFKSLAATKSKAPCDQILTADQWRCLWAYATPKSPRATQVPTMEWALYAVAKLAGWQDTKRTGKVGWETLWRGWTKLDEMAEGWRLARQTQTGAEDA